MAKHLVIVGMVQGIGYRAAFADQAEFLGLNGWVRNRRDGSVEALIHGGEKEVEAIITWSKSGPPGARVSNVIVEESNLAVDDAFIILPTL